MLEFAFGVMVTIALEAVATVVFCMKLALKDRKEGGKEHAEETPVPTGNYNGGSKWNDGTG